MGNLIRRRSSLVVADIALVTAAVAVCAALGSSPVRAATGSLNEALRKCAAITADDERLACFDAAAKRLEAPTPATPPARTPEEQFGAPKAPPPPAADKPPEPPPIDRIDATVAAVAKRPNGELVVTLSNGQVWAQVPSGTTFRLNVGDEVSISRGMFGSYILSTEAKRSIKVTRQQ
jgi:hypothetical protein